MWGGLYRYGDEREGMYTCREGYIGTGIIGSVCIEVGVI